MRLTKKTLCYSVLISAVLMAFVVVYFCFMMPSLYVDYAKKDDLKSVVDVQKGYMKNRSYKGLTVKNPTGSMSVEIPLSGDTVYIAGKNFRITVQADEPELKEFLQEIQQAFSSGDDMEDIQLPDIDKDRMKSIFNLNKESLKDLPVNIHLEADEDLNDDSFKEKKMKTHVISDNIIVFEGGIIDDTNEYTSYIAAGRTSDALILSFLPVMTPQMNEITPVVLSSLPMLMAVVFLIVLIASRMFSRKIVIPVIRLAQYAEEVKMAGHMEIEPLSVTSKDEIGELGATLNELYGQLRLQYQALEQKNQALAQENKRQEVFLRASSHQLKTPVTAALLLVEGMMNEVGKYKDTQKYLPQVKQQLKIMQKIVEDILYLNHCTEHMEKESFDLKGLADEIVLGYQVQASTKNLTFRIEGASGPVCTDRDMLKKIVDNLVSNAVSYTPAGNLIQVTLEEKCLKIFNHGGHIEESLLPDIYEPFVSSDVQKKGRGLGLYILSYYAQILGCDVKIVNESGGVLAILRIP